VGKDADRGKLTFPTVLGAEESRRRALALADEAVAALTPCGAAAGELVRLACWIVNRDH
jgi:geranylgeranyl diphosphate synthase type II